MCLNFVKNGTCNVDGRWCSLGPRGAVARNEDRECELHGGFDVWVMNDRLLVTDLGFPAEEPVQSLAFGVNETVAMTIAMERSKQSAIPISTSKRRCIKCGGSYWMSQHVHSAGLIQNGHANFCPNCIDSSDSLEIYRTLGQQRRWCG